MRSKYGKLWVLVFCPMAFLLVIYTRFHSSTVEVAENDLTKLSSNRTKEVTANREPHMILIVTLWRSGSTWVGELISRTPNTFYVYEPLHMIQYHYNETRIEMFKGLKSYLISQLLHCSISLQFMKHLRKWPALYKKQCLFNCNMPQFITSHCLNSNMKLIKTVRLTLEEVEEMFTKPSLRNLKVIYLVRDPRGTINSLVHMEKSVIDVTPEEICPRLRGDMHMYTVLKKLYPDRMFFLRYEDLASHSHEKSQEVWKFISGNEPFPDSWKYFLNKTSEAKSNATKHIGAFNINKKSSLDWEVWRRSITGSTLKMAEKDCGDIIANLGYRHFRNINETLNSKLSSILFDNCTSVPCGQFMNGGRSNFYSMGHLGMKNK